MSSSLVVAGTGHRPASGASSAAKASAAPLSARSSKAGAQAPAGQLKTDSTSISVAALQYQLGEVRSQIQQVSASCSTCDPNRLTALAPLYAKAQTLQSLISSASAAQ